MAPKMQHLNLCGSRYMYATVHGIRIIAPDKRTIHEVTKAVEVLRHDRAAHRAVLATRMLVCIARPADIDYGYLTFRMNYEPVFVQHVNRALRMTAMWFASGIVHEGTHARDYLDKKFKQVGHEVIYHPMPLRELEVRASANQAGFLQRAGVDQYYIDYVLAYPNSRDWTEYENGSFFDSKLRKYSMTGCALYEQLLRRGIVRPLNRKKKRLD